eukprot:6655333-Prymnesium_polylepis.2
MAENTEPGFAGFVASICHRRVGFAAATSSPLQVPKLVVRLTLIRMHGTVLVTSHSALERSTSMLESAVNTS